MKKYLLATSCLVFAAISLQAQQKQGFVSYDRTSKLQISFQGMPGGMEQQMPTTRTDKFELTFGNNQSLWKAAEQEDDGAGDFARLRHAPEHRDLVVALEKLGRLRRIRIIDAAGRNDRVQRLADLGRRDV